MWVKILEFPSSALLAVSFLLSVYALHHYAGGNRTVGMMSSTRTAAVLLAVGAVMLGIEGTWSVEIHRSVVFMVYSLILLASLQMTVLNGIRRKAKAGFILNHLGIMVVVCSSLFGAPDVIKSKMIVGRDHAVNIAYTQDGMAVPLPFDVSLREFSIDYYADGSSPKQFTSRLTVGSEQMETSVNHPCSYKGYTIYQDSYDRMAGRYTVLQIVRDPWLNILYVGMLLLAAGSVLLLFGRWNAKVTVPATILLTALFTALTIAKINFGTLMPALRSWWFVFCIWWHTR